MVWVGRSDRLADLVGREPTLVQTPRNVDDQGFWVFSAIRCAVWKKERVSWLSRS